MLADSHAGTSVQGRSVYGMGGGGSDKKGREGTGMSWVSVYHSIQDEFDLITRCESTGRREVIWQCVRSREWRPVKDRLGWGGCWNENGDISRVSIAIVYRLDLTWSRDEKVQVAVKYSGFDPGKLYTGVTTRQGCFSFRVRSQPIGHIYRQPSNKHLSSKSGHCSDMY